MDGTEIQIGQSEALNAPRRLTSILITDICEFSRLAENDEASAIRLTDVLYALFESTTERHGGRVFKRIADGFLAEFPSAQSAMAVALEFLEEVKARNNLAPNAIKAEIRAALHVGDVTDRADGDIMGHGVNIASRLQELAEPGTILASSNIMNLLGRDFPHKGVKRGNLALKNISEPVTAFQIDPDKDGGFQWPILPGFFKTRNLAYLLIGATVLFGALTLQAQRQERLLDEKLDRIMVQSFDNQSSVSNGVSAPYIRNVLENLHRSNIPSHQASFALLEEGNIPMAIQRLEDSLDGMEHGSEEHINTMHQIAALSYNFDTLKARSYYELILYQNPNDRSALFWLVRTYILLVDPESAIRTIEGIVENQDLTEKEKARLQMDMGFNLMIKGDFKTAADLLETLEPEIIRLDNDDLTLKWMVDLAIAYERLDQVDESERLLFEAIEKIEQTGINAHLPRAYNVMGLIWEKRASSYPSYSVDYLRRALDFYEKQFSAGQTLNKLREQSEALHFQGRVRLELADIDRANENFSKSFQLSREHGHVGSEFKARLGLAQIEYARGNTEAACRHVTGAERHFEKNMGPNLGPTSRKILKELGCGFKPVPDL